MTPHAFIEPKEMVGRQRDDDRCCEKQRKVLPVVCGWPVSEINHLCQSIARADRYHVKQQEQQASSHPAGARRNADLAHDPHRRVIARFPTRSLYRTPKSPSDTPTPRFRHPMITQVTRTASRAA